MQPMEQDPHRDREAQYREGVHRGLDALYTLVAGARDADGIRWMLGTIEAGAFELWTRPPRDQGPVARRIVAELHRSEEYGRSWAFNAGVHASTFIALELADLYRDRDDILAALDLAEDVACTACVRHWEASGRGLAERIVAEVRPRMEASRAGDDALESYRYGD
jgi:hypothetical protein